MRRALESVRECDDIIICDGGSTDNTLDIAKAFGARVVEQDARYKSADGRIADYSGMRNQCVDTAKNKWFLYIDSDESASPELIDDIRKIVAEAIDCAAFRVPEQFVVDGRVIEYASNYPGYQYRLLRTDKGTRFVKPVHEQPPRFLQTPNRSCVTSGPWIVYWEQEDVDDYAKRNYKYIPMEIARSAGLARGGYFMRFVPWHLRAIAAVVVKTLRDRILHPLASHMPLRVELGRVRYQSRLILEVGKAVLRHRKII